MNNKGRKGLFKNITGGWRLFNFCWRNLAAPLQGLAESECSFLRTGRIWGTHPTYMYINFINIPICVLWTYLSYVSFLVIIRVPPPLRKLAKSGGRSLTNGKIWVYPSKVTTPSNILWMFPNINPCDTQTVIDWVSGLSICHFTSWDLL